jgi:hypothetical protein
MYNQTKRKRKSRERENKNKLKAIFKNKSFSAGVSEFPQFPFCHFLQIFKPLPFISIHTDAIKRIL